MHTLINKYLTSFLSVYFISQINLGLSISDNWESYFFSTFVLFVLLLLKPVIDTLLFPVNLLTLNLTNWLTYIFFIYIWSVLTPAVKFISIDFPGLNIGPLAINRMYISYWFSVIFTSLAIILAVKFFSWIMK